MTPDATEATPSLGPHEDEPHDDGGTRNRLNWLRAGVLGANDGIVSTAGIVVGVAGASSDRTTILVAGVAGLVAGALSMATAEYVSVSGQRDSEQALLRKEAAELLDDPEEELAELAGIYVGKGLDARLALEVAVQLTEHDALGAHAEAELGIDPNDLTNPWHAALASLVSFSLGALLPLVIILVMSAQLRVGVTFAAVTVALAGTGYLSARLGHAPVRRAVVRNVLGGAVAMAVTFGVGSLLNTTGIV